SKINDKALFLLFTSQFFPISDSLGDLAFEASIGRRVEGPRLHLLGPVIVAGKALGHVMVVSIALAVADLLHQPRRRVEDGLGRHQRSGLLGRAPRALLGAV